MDDDLMSEYIEFVAVDGICQWDTIRSTMPKIHLTCEMISVEGKTNFFEKGYGLLQSQRFDDIVWRK